MSNLWCGRPTHKELKYCIFHAKPEEKTEKEFKNALKEYINEIKKEDKNYDFKGFIFIGDVDFKKDLSITIFKNVIFDGVTFKGDVNFEGVTFKEWAKFDGAIFERRSKFEEATFKELVFLLGQFLRDFQALTRQSLREMLVLMG